MEKQSSTDPLQVINKELGLKLTPETFVYPAELSSKLIILLEQEKSSEEISAQLYKIFSALQDLRMTTPNRTPEQRAAREAVQVAALMVAQTRIGFEAGINAGSNEVLNKITFGLFRKRK